MSSTGKPETQLADELEMHPRRVAEGEGIVKKLEPE